MSHRIKEQGRLSKPAVSHWCSTIIKELIHHRGGRVASLPVSCPQFNSATTRCILREVQRLEKKCSLLLFTIAIALPAYTFNPPAECNKFMSLLWKLLKGMLENVENH